MKEVDTKGVNNKNVYSTKIAYGKPKPIDEVSLQDMQENPIWVFALDEEDSEEIDETWQKPILNYDNVTHELVEAYILMKSTDGQYDISANLDIKKKRQMMSLTGSRNRNVGSRQIISRITKDCNSLLFLKSRKNPMLSSDLTIREIHFVP